MAWKKYFNTYTNQPKASPSPISGAERAAGSMSRKNYNTFLPEVYSGQSNRVDRYYQYEIMDQDPEVNSALDILAEFCTETNPDNSTQFKFHFNEQPTDVEVKILNQTLLSWYRLNELDRRMFRIFRNTLKYGDQFLVRDPETFKLYHVDARNVDKVIVNESEGKKPEQYVFRDLNVNLQGLTISQLYPGNTSNTTYSTTPSVMGATPPRGSQYNFSSGGQTGGRFNQGQNQYAVAAEHVIHLSLSEGLDSAWPFGMSILENVFKTFKQKELIEDAVIIYRVQRAPERRIFYVDTGNLPSHLAMQFLERVKNEIYQRRIPSLTGGSANITDATYNPISMNEDFFFAQNAEGKGSRVETLQGGQNLGEIDDLRFFTNKLFRALRIPSSYMPTGPDDSAAVYNDGRMGTALIQELRFNKYCERLQNLISPLLDTDFKVYIKQRGINIDTSMFDLKFTEPQNFSQFKTVDVDSNRLNNFNTAVAFPFVSKRWAMARYLGLSEQEIVDNEEQWKREHNLAEFQPSGTDLRSVGVTSGGMEADLAPLDNLGAPETPEAPPPEIGAAEVGAPASVAGAPGAGLPGVPAI